MSRPIPPSYKTRNWPAYNEALKQRGSLTIWVDPDMAWMPPPTGKRGRQPQYSDAAIQTCLTMKVLFGMALRQTTGFVESLLRLVGLNWSVPDFSTLSRRQKALAVTIPYRGSQGPLNLLIDSTGIKAEGEGEWQAFFRHVVYHVQHPKPSAVGELVVNEVDGPSAVRDGRQRDRCSRHRNPSAGLASPNRQPFLAVEPLGLLAVHDMPLLAEQDVQAAVSKPPPLIGQLP